MKKDKPSAKKQKKKKIIITTLAVGATGILGYFGWQYYKKKKQAKRDDMQVLINKVQDPVITQPIVTPKTKTTSKQITYRQPVVDRVEDFPLKKGSKGENVRRLQEALIAKYGSQTLPKYGADGDFGSETVNALKKLGLPTTITESTYNVIAQGVQSSTNPGAVGKELYSAAVAKDLNKTITQLKKLK